MDESWLKAKLEQAEDQWVERKPAFDEKDVRKTLVAFANSVPFGGDPAILFLGASNSGRHPFLQDADDVQKKVRGQAEGKAYPPIVYSTRVLSFGDSIKKKEILAVIIPASERRPHFGGIAWVRRGSESISAPDEVFRDLVASQNEKARRFLEWKNKSVILRICSRPTGLYLEYNNAVLTDVDARSITLDTREGWFDSFTTETSEFHKLLPDKPRIVVYTSLTEGQWIRRMIQAWCFGHLRVEGTQLPIDWLRYIVDQLLDNLRVTFDVIRIVCHENPSPPHGLLLLHAEHKARLLGLKGSR